MIEMAREQSPEKAMESFGEYYVGMSYSLDYGHDYTNIIETTSNQIIGQLRRQEDGLWYNIPFHLYKTFSDRILNNFDLINNSSEFDESMYSSLYMAYEYEDLSKYMFYLGMCISGIYDLDINRSNVHLYEEGKVFIEGERKDWVVVEDELTIDRTLYLINIYDNANVFILEKIFEADTLEPVKTHVKLEELNKAILDELKG